MMIPVKVVLHLKALGVSINDFDFVSPPPKKALLRALEVIKELMMERSVKMND